MQYYDNDGPDHNNEEEKMMSDANLPELCYGVDEEDTKKERKEEGNYGNEEEVMPLKMAGYGRI